MNTLIDLFNVIESPRFSAELSLASSERMFLEILASHPTIHLLLERIKSNRRLLEVVFHRIFTVSQITFDRKFENPSDAAIAAYAWVLHQSHSIYADAAIQIAVTVENGWWAGKIAHAICPPSGESSKDVRSVNDWGAPNSILSWILSPSKSTESNTLLHSHGRSFYTIGEDESITPETSATYTTSRAFLEGLTRVTDASSAKTAIS